MVSGVALIGTILYLLYFASTLPFHQSSVPIIVTFYSNTCGLIAIAILLNVMCMSMAREKKYTSPPKFLTKLFSGFMGKVLCLGNYSHQVSSTHQRLNVELSSIDDNNLFQETANGTTQEQQTAADLAEEFRQPNFGDKNSIIMQDWIMVAAGLERLFFIVYAFAFAVVTSIYV